MVLTPSQDREGVVLADRLLGGVGRATVLPMTGAETWTIVGAAAGVATAVATAVSALVSVLMRWWDRPRPDWAVDGKWEYGSSYGGDPDRPPTLVATITNAGDGPAFRMTVRGDRCETGLARPLPHASTAGTRSVPESFTAVLAPGDSRRLWASKVTDEMYRSAAFILEWTESPTRRGKRRNQRLPLAACAEAPKGRPSLNEETGQYE